MTNITPEHPDWQRRRDLVTAAVSTLTQCKGCTGCCRELSYPAQVTEYDVPLHSIAKPRQLLGGLWMPSRENGDCSMLDHKDGYGCSLHPSRTQVLNSDLEALGGAAVGQLPIWPFECMTYPFYALPDGRIVVAATCAHIGDLLHRLIDREPAAAAAAATLIDLLPSITPTSLSQHWEHKLTTEHFVATIFLGDPRVRHEPIFDHPQTDSRAAALP